MGVVSSLYLEKNVFTGCDADTYYLLLKNGYSPAGMVAPERPTTMDDYKSQEEVLEDLKVILERAEAFRGPAPWVDWMVGI